MGIGIRPFGTVEIGTTFQCFLVMWSCSSLCIALIDSSRSGCWRASSSVVVSGSWLAASAEILFTRKARGFIEVGNIGEEACSSSISSGSDDPEVKRVAMYAWAGVQQKVAMYAWAEVQQCGRLTARRPCLLTGSHFSSETLGWRKDSTMDPVSSVLQMHNNQSKINDRMGDCLHTTNNLMILYCISCYSGIEHANSHHSLFLAFQISNSSKITKRALSDVGITA